MLDNAHLQYSHARRSCKIRIINGLFGLHTFFGVAFQCNFATCVKICVIIQIRRRVFDLSFLFLSDGTRTHLNATRTSAAGEGLTEPLYSLLSQGESKRKSSPVIRTAKRKASNDTPLAPYFSLSPLAFSVWLWYNLQTFL